MIIINNDDKHKVVILIEDIGVDLVSVNVVIDGEEVDPSQDFSSEESPSIKILIPMRKNIVLKNNTFILSA